MRKTLIFLPLMMLLSVASLAARIAFYEDFNEALKAAGEQNKKLLITFKSPT
ncbi:MAG: hypothetical protein R3F48_08030 [Candidatus Zixiibacteriota bacterium]